MISVVEVLLDHSDLISPGEIRCECECALLWQSKRARIIGTCIRPATIEEDGISSSYDADAATGTADDAIPSAHVEVMRVIIDSMRQPLETISLRQPTGYDRMLAHFAALITCAPSPSNRLSLAMVYDALDTPEGAGLLNLAVVQDPNGPYTCAVQLFNWYVAAGERPAFLSHVSDQDISDLINASKST